MPCMTGRGVSCPPKGGKRASAAFSLLAGPFHSQVPPIFANRPLVRTGAASSGMAAVYLNTLEMGACVVNTVTHIAPSRRWTNHATCQ